MATNVESVDPVRASRDGHEYHEAWTARKAMQLLLPRDALIGIAVEGLEPVDQSIASAETVEVADLTVYYGKAATFKSANRVETIQFKYSVSRRNRAFRASDAKKTIKKFAAAYRDYKEKHGAKLVTDKLQFELITNRPIYPPLHGAIEGIAAGKQLTGEARKQAKQFKEATHLSGKPLAEFADKCLISGLSGSLADTKKDLSRILVDWSATPYVLATSRIGKVRGMVREKAGHAGTNRNVIRSVDVLDALEISDVDELLPCPASLAEVGEVVDRAQLSEAAALIPNLDKPLLVHAAGGVGKTVFLESLAATLSGKHEVVFFDCFGGGRYRASHDARHLPNRGLVHIANMLACRGLCDPLLPGSDNMETLFNTFIKRLSQSVKALSTASPERHLILFIDAIDNAADHAKDRHQPSFPTLLLESLQLSPVPGVKLIVSCRSHRKDISVKDVSCEDFELQPFTLPECESYLRTRISGVIQTEIQVAQARSGGNARILEHLVSSDRGLLDSSEINNPINLDDLLRERIDTSLAEAVRLGSRKADIYAFLAGLSVLPPPVPLEEYAGAHNMDIGAIQSFAADLAPLLERTRHGLMFRDEPTETFVRESYGANERALKRVARNLLARQDESVYAARALPGLLQKLDDGNKLFKLAFDERFPSAIESTVGQRRIRHARLKAAVLHAANSGDSNRLVHLLVELSTIAAVDQKGADYILDNPDLVVTAQDVDALRRLFETRTQWPGARHARLSIASVLSGDLDDASRYEKGAEEWMQHYLRRDQENDIDRVGPERLDSAAIAVFMIAQQQSDRAILYMQTWYDWYAYETSEHIFSLLRLAEQTSPQQDFDINGFLDGLTKHIGCIAAALSFLNLSAAKRRKLIAKLAKASVRTPKLKLSGSFSRERIYELPDGLRKASAIASSLGLGDEALKISLRAPHDRPSVWSVQDRHYDKNVFPFLFRVALVSAVKGKQLREQDILPRELVPICRGMGRALLGADFRKKLKERLQRRMQKVRDHSEESDKIISTELMTTAEHFIDICLEPLFELTKAFALLLAAPLRKADFAFLKLVNTWTEVRNLKDQYSVRQYNHFFQHLGSHMAIFALWARSDLKVASVRTFLRRLHEQQILDPQTLIEVVAMLAVRPRLHVVAGQEAAKARDLIEKEDEVITRTSLYAHLSRAILPASREDATEYFKIGLEQMDAIGSGDYDFTNELLLFASSVKGNELTEKDFHTLTNICELNMSYEEEKFPWAAFASGLSKTSGCRGLAKLSRWHDRSKISLEYTLLPYLTALIRDGKIEPEDALALNRLTDPVELWACNTEDFANAIHEKRFPKEKSLVSELIQQFEDNNPGIPMDKTVKSLSAIAKQVLGKRHATTRRLSIAYRRYRSVRDELNDQRNYHGQASTRLGREPRIPAHQNKTNVQKLVNSTIPTNEESLALAVDQLSQMKFVREAEAAFFDRLRSKVSLGDRSTYVRLLARMEHLDSYAKFRELGKCKVEWEDSSVALRTTYRGLAVPILHIHAEEFLRFGHLSEYQFRELTDLTDVPLSDLCLELIKLFASPDWAVPAAAWLGLASIISDDADAGEGQKALARLLNSSSAKLTSNVADGPWKNGLYPPEDVPTIAAGMIWMMLGSPLASDRWRAAHCVRSFAKFERWHVIDALVARFSSKDAKGFHAPELPFYYLHSQLWLLIALARVAIDSPKHVARYSKLLLEVVFDDEMPHLLMRHFAAKAILACIDAGNVRTSDRREKRLRAIDQSPFPPLAEKSKESNHNEFYQGRPKKVPKPNFNFRLDYDFEKYDVHGLADVFDQPGWKVKDLISDEVRSIDANASSMHESGGRETSRSRRMVGSSTKYHGYGEYLGWHGFMFVAGRLLQKYPVTEDCYYGASWAEWLSRRVLTRRDGLWLSDGMDRPPLITKLNMLEKARDGVVLTGNKDKLMSLVGIADSMITKKIVVEGRWKSPDDIAVYISSVIVKPRVARRLARQLIKEKPFLAWLPTYDCYEGEEEHLRNDKKEYDPWIAYPSTEGGRLDDDDPLSVIAVERRPRFDAKTIDEFSLKHGDPFTRQWTTARRKTVAMTDAWGYESPYEDQSDTGVRLVCSADFLRKLLTKRNRDLLLLIKLQRYETEMKGLRDSRFSHTVAVLRIRKDLKYEYFPGPVNQTYQSNLW